MAEFAIFHRYPSEKGIPSFTSRGNKDEHLNFSGKRGEMKKRVDGVWTRIISGEILVHFSYYI